MTDRTGIFEGDNPFQIARAWMAEAEAHTFYLESRESYLYSRQTDLRAHE